VLKSKYVSSSGKIKYNPTKTHYIDKTKRTKVKTLIRKAKFKDSMLSIMYEFSPYRVVVFMIRVVHCSK
jgi:hypothetical protein